MGTFNSFGQLNRSRPIGAQKVTQKPAIQNRVKPTQRPLQRPNQSTQQPVRKQPVRQAQPLQNIRTTQKPVTQKTLKVSDESFFDLLKILEEGKTKEDNPTPNKKVFSLNVDESGKVNQQYGKPMSNPKNSLQNRLQKTPPVFKKPVDKVVKIPTTKAP